MKLIKLFYFFFHFIFFSSSSGLSGPLAFELFSFKLSHEGPTSPHIGLIEPIVVIDFVLQTLHHPRNHVLQLASA